MKSLIRQVSAVGLFCWLASAANAYVTESEPNDTFAEADTLLCGDTVYCAALVPENDLDHFRFVTRSGDSIIIGTFSCDSGRANTLMALFDDRDSILAVNDDGGPGQYSLIRYRAIYTGDYLLRVLNLSGSTVDTGYSLSLWCPNSPPEDYDLCETARVIDALPYYNEGTTLGATHQCGTSSPDVFYQLNLPAAGNMFITVCTNAFDARVQVLGRCCRDFMDDASEGCGTGAELIVFGATPGVYWILVEGTVAMEYGDFSIEVSASLPGCPSPEPVVVTTIADLPLLDWPEFVGPGYYVVWQSWHAEGPWEHLGTTFHTFFIDSAGFAATRRFYHVTSVCPW